jgi:hypothetical protein
MNGGSSRTGAADECRSKNAQCGSFRQDGRDGHDSSSRFLTTDGQGIAKASAVVEIMADKSAGQVRRRSEAMA